MKYSRRESVTRKDFELIASVIYKLRLVNDAYDLEVVAARLSAKLEETNENFDPDKFLKECGVR